jgi:hypothetical protein
MAVIAKAGTAAHIPVQSSLRLDGTASEGTALRFTWKVVSGQSGFSLADSATARPDFTPLEAGVFVLQLTVTDGVDSDSASMVVTATPFIAVIQGEHEGVQYDAVLLDGSRSQGPEGMSFSWEVRRCAASDAAGWTAASTLDPGAHTPRDKDKFSLVVEDPDTYTVRLLLSANVVQGGVLKTISTASFHRVVVGKRRDEEGSADDAWWAEKQLKDTRGALASLQEAANKWEASVASFLALFGGVAFIAGPATLTDLNWRVAAVAQGVILVAFVLALLAIYQLASLGHGGRGLGKGRSPQDYREEHRQAVNRGVRRLDRARWLSVAAAALIAIGSTIVGFASLNFGSAEANKVFAFVQRSDQTVCGVLTSAADGKLQLGGAPIGAGEQVTIVASCPPPPSS